MADIVWPTSLPQRALVDGYNKEYANNKIESGMESGNVKQRLRFTTAPTSFSVSFQMNLEEKDIFKEFYEDTLAYGTREYEWVVPAQDDDDNTAMFRIIGSPTERAIAGNLFTITMNLQQQV